MKTQPHPPSLTAARSVEPSRRASLSSAQTPFEYWKGLAVWVVWFGLHIIFSQPEHILLGWPDPYPHLFKREWSLLVRKQSCLNKPNKSWSSTPWLPLLSLTRRFFNPRFLCLTRPTNHIAFPTLSETNHLPPWVLHFPSPPYTFFCNIFHDIFFTINFDAKLNFIFFLRCGFSG